MKKSLLFSAMALSLGLLSCNQEDMSDVETVTGTPVTVSVEVPGALSGSESRTLPAAPEGHQLRCIMVVDYNTTEDVRMEQVAGETMVNEKFRFTFTPAEKIIPVFSGLTMWMEQQSRMVSIPINIIIRPI